jgi:hypothetical protein
MVGNERGLTVVDKSDADKVRAEGWSFAVAIRVRGEMLGLIMIRTD